MSGMFNRPVEIYQQGSLTWPTYKISEEKLADEKNENDAVRVIMLSWHGKMHYNSVIALKKS
jgi:hypothetical protein